MKPRQLTVFVTGATGRQGGAVARHLLARGHQVHAFTRKPESPAARSLRSKGARIVVGDLDNPSVLRLAIDGIDALFVATTPFEGGPARETRHGMTLVDVAREARIDHVLFTSVASAHQDTRIPHFDSKLRIERYLLRSDVPWTVIAPVFFMENLRSPPLLSGLRANELALPLPPQRPLQMIAADDIGAFAAHVFENRREYLGKRIEIASDELSGERAAQILSKICKRRISYRRVPLAEVRERSPDLAAMYEWLDRVGYSVDIAGLRRRETSVKWHRFDQWVKQAGVKELLAPEPVG